MKKLNKEALLGLIMVVMGLIFVGMTLQLPNTESQLFDSRFVPILVSIIMILMGIPQFIQNLSKPQEITEKYDNKTLLITIILLIFYVMFYQKLGFVVTSIIFLFLEITNLTPHYVNKNYLVTGAIALIFPILLYYLFYFGFKIILPAGILKGIL